MHVRPPVLLQVLQHRRQEGPQRVLGLRGRRRRERRGPRPDPPLHTAGAAGEGQPPAEPGNQLLLRLAVVRGQQLKRPQAGVRKGPAPGPWPRNVPTGNAPPVGGDGQAGMDRVGGGGGGCGAGVGGISTSQEAGVDTAPLPRPPPPSKKGSIDAPPPPPPPNPNETDLPGLGGDPDPKFGKNEKWDCWNQRVEGVQTNHHLPCI